MRSVFSVLIIAIALAVSVPTPGKRTLVVLEKDSLRDTHSMFLSNLEGTLCVSVT